jgi:ribose-phosphate pyrophosphokinase
VAELINSLGFARVYVKDPHSEVVSAVLNNIQVIDNKHTVHQAVFVLEKGGAKVALVSPDAGALKKVYGYASYGPLGLDVVRADKTRNTKTGKITGTVVHSEHLGDTNLLVVDDIADGGFTFTQLAPELRKITNGTVPLFVTHGLFTKGVDIVADAFDNVFVANNMFGPHPKLKEI